MHFCHQEIAAIALAVNPANWILARYAYGKVKSFLKNRVLLRNRA